MVHIQIYHTQIMYQIAKVPILAYYPRCFMLFFQFSMQHIFFNRLKNLGLHKGIVYNSASRALAERD